MRLIDLSQIHQTLDPGEVNDLLADGWKIIQLSPSAAGPVYVLGVVYKDDRDTAKEEGPTVSEGPGRI